MPVDTPNYWTGTDPYPETQLVLSIEEDEDLPMVKPKVLTKVTSKLSID
jgi:hypothetical protein